MQTSSFHVSLRSDDFLSLMTTNKGWKTRSVYLTEVSDSGEIAVVENLEFSLFLAIPQSLDPNLFYLEMLRSYHSAHWGTRHLEKLKREGETSRAELLILEKRNQILINFQSLMKKSDCGVIKNQATRVQWIRSQLRSEQFFSVIRDMSSFTLPTGAKLSEKLRWSSQWRLKFDNHQVYRFFLTLFHSPFPISFAKDVTEIVQDEEGGGGGEESEKTKRVYTPVDYDVMMLSGADSDSYLCKPRADTHDEEILKQLKQFPQADHIHSWKFTPTQEGSPLPTLLASQDCHFHPVNPSSPSPSPSPSSSTAVDSLSTLKKLHGKTKRPAHSLQPNGLDFQFSPSTRILLFDYKVGRRSLLVTKKGKKKEEEEKEYEGEAEVKRKVVVQKPPPVKEVLRGSTKRTFFSLGKGEGDKPLKQPMLGFVMTKSGGGDEGEKKQKLFITTTDNNQ